MSLKEHKEKLQFYRYGFNLVSFGKIDNNTHTESLINHIIKLKEGYYNNLLFSKEERYRMTEKGRLAIKRGSNKRRRLIKKLKGKHTEQEWKKVLKESKGICLECNKEVGRNKLTKDHIIPISKGGTDYISNIQALCRSCNSSKNNFIDIRVKKALERKMESQHGV